jgi:AcrR family transcriptional regulator
VKKGNAASVSTIDICAAAKITRPTLYSYFRGKRELLMAVHGAAMERDLKPYIEKAASIGDPVERLTYMVRTYTKEIICVHPELRVLIHDTLTVKDKYFRDVKTEWKKHYFLLRDTIGQIQSEGRISPTIDPSLTALFLLGMLTWTTYWFDFDHKSGIDKVANLAEQLVFNALGLKNQTSKPDHSAGF